jgi:hypothetical protein
LKQNQINSRENFEQLFALKEQRFSCSVFPKILATTRQALRHGHFSLPPGFCRGEGGAALRVKSVSSHLYEIFKVAPVVYPTVTLSMNGGSFARQVAAYGHDVRALARPPATTANQPSADAACQHTLRTER